MSIIRFCILLALFILVAGCASSDPTPNPLAGFNFCFSPDPAKLDKAIQADYLDYIQKLPTKERKFAYYASDFEDGTGRHAIAILIELNGTEWTHVLIYDRDNKRIKVTKYISGHYAS